MIQLPIAGVIKKWSDSAGLELADMGRTLTHGSSARFLISCPGQIYLTSELRSCDISASIALLQVDVTDGTCKQISNVKTRHCVYDSDRLAGKALLRNNHELRSLEGGFAIACHEDATKVRVARDSIGTRPIYIGERPDLYAFATEKKALWSIGASVLGILRPGFTALIGPNGYAVNYLSTLKRVEASITRIEECSPQLVEILTSTVQKIIDDSTSVGVLFSGGIDSTLTAAITMRCAKDVRLFVSGLEGSRDLLTAEKVATELGARLTSKIVAADDFESILRRTTYEAEVDEPMHVAIAAVLGQACSAASRENYRVCLSGQGSDEQFGGYARYRKIPHSRFEHVLNNALWNDILELGIRDLPRDYASAVNHGVVLETPFLNVQLIQFAMRISPTLKILGETDNLRKHPIREAARLIGISYASSNLPKLAAQFGSRFDIHLRLLAKNKGLSSKSYCRRLAEEAFRMELGREPAPETFFPLKTLV